MGIVHVHRGRLAPALILAVLMALVIVATLGVVARPAAAQDTSSSTTCGSCHDYCVRLTPSTAGHADSLGLHHLPRRRRSTGYCAASTA